MVVHITEISRRIRQSMVGNLSFRAEEKKGKKEKHVEEEGLQISGRKNDR